MDRPIPLRARPHATSAQPDRVVRALSADALADLDPRVERPTYDLGALRSGVVHLGVGAFHRAHQAVYLDRIAEQGISLDWGVVGIGLRRSRHRTELLGQDCLYTVVELGENRPRMRVVGALRDYLSAVEQPTAALAALVEPRTRLVTLTITAPSYADGRAGSTFSLLAAALERRRRAGVAPFTVLSCDNLPGNGEATRRCVVAAASRYGPEVTRWIETHVAFPNSMADRITPPTSEQDVRALRRHLGLHDRAPVLTEPFSRWVVEDTFCGDRPPLEEVGAQLVSDVRPYVAMKMRMLNAAHVALGYLGASSPHASTDTAMADPALGSFVERMLAEEVQPVLEPVAGMDVDGYRDEVLRRLRNPAMPDPLSRLRRRGSVRVRNYVLPSIEAALAQRRPHSMLTSVVAAWIEDLGRFAETVRSGEATTAEVMAQLEDPAAIRLLAPALSAHEDVRPLLAATEGFDGVRRSPQFVESLQTALTALRETGRAAS